MDAYLYICIEHRPLRAAFLLGSGKGRLYAGAGWLFYEKDNQMFTPIQFLAEAIAEAYESVCSLGSGISNSGVPI